VVTVGSIHGGTKHNIIPDDVKLQLTVRSYEDATRETLLSEIKQIALKVAEAHRVPRAPEVKPSDHTPAVYHDPGLSERMRGVFERLLGKEKVLAADPVMGGEDFGYYPRHYGVPGLQFRMGGASPAMIAGGNVPGLHSSKWAVDPEPTLRAGVAAFARGVLDLLGSK
jgi:hippurate hydrolase